MQITLTSVVSLVSSKFDNLLTRLRTLLIIHLQATLKMYFEVIFDSKSSIIYIHQIVCQYGHVT
jgi:hypothetical protein